MEEGDYVEIQELQKLLKSYNILIKKDGRYLDKEKTFFGICMTVKGHSFLLYTDDEYNDFDEQNQLLCLCLVLRELEIYEDASDFLVWCNFTGLQPAEETVRAYYMELRNTYAAIEKFLGKIDSCISHLDFQLNSGAAQTLRNMTNP
ncbi:hypothetical protein [Leptobacterium sp. I13]|uniref:hypothetical protein n=1 Tax=Leptobacterium meishanense TaxID=3128904 RepID=UPI0030EE6DE6